MEGHKLMEPLWIHWVPLRRHKISTGINNLNDDILVDILRRLPMKCMVSSQSVCKLWYRLILTVCIPTIMSSPPHSILYNASTTPGTKGPWNLAWMKYYPHQTTSLVEFCHVLPFTPSPENFLDCCNGFFLFFDPSNMQYYVCNPLTEQCIAIPNFPGNKIPNSGALAFDPYCKVVQISREPFSVHIFSLEFREWIAYKLCSVPPIIENSAMVSRHIFLNGSLYRLSLSGYLLILGISPISLIAFSLPQIVLRKRPIGCIGMSQDSLHYAWDDGKSQMTVWMLSRGTNGHEWLLKYTICHQYFIDHPICSNLQDQPMFTVYAFHPTLNVLVVGNFTGIYQYDPCRGMLETVCRLPPGTSVCGGQCLVFPFSPTLTALEFE